MLTNRCYHDIRTPVIGLGAIFSSNNLSKVNTYYLGIEMVKIVHKIAQKCTNCHIEMFSDKITEGQSSFRR